MPRKSLTALPLERREEIEHRDLDHDGEVGEPRAHQIKVLGRAKVDAMDKKKLDDKKPDKKADKKPDDKKADKKADDKKADKKPDDKKRK